MARRRVSLDGIWKFCPAFTELEANQSFMAPQEGSAEGRTGEPRDIGWIEPGFDDTGWLDIHVPDTWNKAIPDLWSYEGIGWYRRIVDIPADWEGKRVEFTCDSANYRTVLYVNGRRAGEHEGGYTPFRIPVHPFLVFGGRNTLAISVDNIPKPDRCPGGEFGWWNYGGIYRSAGLLVTEPIYIQDLTVTTTPRQGESLVAVSIKIGSETDTAGSPRISALLRDREGDEVASGTTAVDLHPQASAEAGITLRVSGARLWSPEEPYLYDLSVDLEDQISWSRDSLSLKVGIREVRIDGARLLLNGKPLLVKGFNRHPEYAKTGHMEREEDLKRDLSLIKGLGANALRCHYPNSPRTYELCDEMGILFLSEIPLYQWGRPEVKAESPRALEAAKAQLREMITHLKNHPCVIMWSVSNENMTQPRKETEEYRKLTEMTVKGNLELVDLAHELDPTRPVVEASNCWPGDPVHRNTDLCAVNLYIGTPTPHVDTLHELTDKMHERFEQLRRSLPQKAILVTEFGSWAIRGLKTSYFPGEAYQAALLRNYWAALLREPHFVGGFIWCFQDTDEHRRFEWDYELRVAYGVYDLRRRPKEAVGTVAQMWREAS